MRDWVQFRWSWKGRCPVLSACLYVGVSLTTSSCFLYRKTARPFRPPPIAAKPAPILLPVVMELPADSLWNFHLEASLPATPVMPNLAPPRVTVPPKRLPVSAAAPKVVPTPPTDPQPEPTPVPKLGQVFTAEQVRDYNKSYEDSLAGVRRSVTAIERKILSAEQAQMLESVRAFQKQAEQAHEQDLLTAVNLARRADLLAKDLLGRLP